MAQHLLSNKFDWLSDGMSKTGYFKFKDDGTYVSNFMEGSWQVIDERSFRKVNKGAVEYILVFDDPYGHEATLTTPVRHPPSKLRLSNNKMEDVPPGFHIPKMELVVES